MAEEKERVWYPLRHHRFNIEDVDDKASADDGEDLLSGGLDDKVKVLRRLPPGEYVTVEQIPTEDKKHTDLSDTSYFQSYIERLRSAGLDIGKGDAEYGYRMPVPKRGANKRLLIVFRRKKVS